MANKKVTGKNAATSASKTLMNKATASKSKTASGSALLGYRGHMTKILQLEYYS